MADARTTDHDDASAPDAGVIAWVDLRNGEPRVNFPLRSQAELEERKDELIQNACEFQSRARFIREVTNPAFLAALTEDFRRDLPLRRMVAATAASALFTEYDSELRRMLASDPEGVLTTRPFLQRRIDGNQVTYTFLPPDDLDLVVLRAIDTIIEPLFDEPTGGQGLDVWGGFTAWIWTNQMAQAMEDLERRIGTSAVDALPVEQLMTALLDEYHRTPTAPDEFRRLLAIYADGLAQITIDAAHQVHLTLAQLEHLLGLRPPASRILVVPALGEHLDRIVREPDAIHLVSPRRFEELVAFSLEHQGYQHVRLTKPTRDGGYDVEAIRDGPIRERVLVECKRYGPEYKVGRPILDALLGVLHRERANIALVATSSYFSRDALALLRQEPWHLQGLDLDAVLRWFAAVRQPARERARAPLP